MRAPRAVKAAIWRIGDVQVPLPRYMTEGAAGMDLGAALVQRLEILPGERTLVPTGLGVAIPPGYEGQVRPRSGLAVREGVTILNAPGTIDSDYRGELKIALINLGKEIVVIEPLDRIAQLIVTPVVHVAWDLLDAAPAEPDEGNSSARGDGGFGHTGRGSSDGDA